QAFDRHIDLLATGRGYSSLAQGLVGPSLHDAQVPGGPLEKSYAHPLPIHARGCLLHQALGLLNASRDHPLQGWVDRLWCAELRRQNMAQLTFHSGEADQRLVDAPAAGASTVCARPAV